MSLLSFAYRFSIHEMTLHWGSLLPQYMVQYCEILTSGDTLANKNIVLTFFWRTWAFMEKRRTQSLHFWSNFDPPFFTWRWAKLKKISGSGKNLRYWAIQICQTEGFVSIYFQTLLNFFSYQPRSKGIFFLYTDKI